MTIAGNKKPATVGGLSRDDAGQGEHSKQQLQVESCSSVHQKSSDHDADDATETHRQDASTLTAPPVGRRDHACWLDRDVEGPSLDDSNFVRDLVDMFGAGRLASDKYQHGRLAGLAVSWHRSAGLEPLTHIEIFGPICDEALSLEPVGMRDEAPPLGWRDEKSHVLYRLDLATIANLAAEAREVATRREVAQNLLDLSDASDSERQAQLDGRALRDSSKTASLVDTVCALYRCKLVGLAPDDNGISLHEDEIAYCADTLQWVFDADDDFEVHLKTSAPQKLAVIVRTCDGEVEHVLQRVRDLCDIICDRVESMRSAGDWSAA